MPSPPGARVLVGGGGRGGRGVASAVKQTRRWAKGGKA